MYASFCFQFTRIVFLKKIVFFQIERFVPPVFAIQCQIEFIMSAKHSRLEEHSRELNLRSTKACRRSSEFVLCAHATFDKIERNNAAFSLRRESPFLGKMRIEYWMYRLQENLPPPECLTVPCPTLGTYGLCKECRTKFDLRIGSAVSSDKVGI
jgi:hypothetical protein